MLICTLPLWLKISTPVEQQLVDPTFLRFEVFVVVNMMALSSGICCLQGYLLPVSAVLMMEATGTSKSLLCYNTLKVFVCVMYPFKLEESNA